MPWLKAGFMRDISHPRLLYLKAALLLLCGFLTGGLLLLDHPTRKAALLLAVCVWSFARAYYFAFYVIEHYADPSFRFAGLVDFARYLARSRGRR